MRTIWLFLFYWTNFCDKYFLPWFPWLKYWLKWDNYLRKNIKTRFSFDIIFKGMCAMFSKVNWWGIDSVNVLNKLTYLDKCYLNSRATEKKKDWIKLSVIWKHYWILLSGQKWVYILFKTALWQKLHLCKKITCIFQNSTHRNCRSF